MGIPLPRHVAEETHAAVARTGSVLGAAKELGISKSTIQNRYERAVQDYGMPDVRGAPQGEQSRRHSLYP